MRPHPINRSKLLVASEKDNENDLLHVVSARYTRLQNANQRAREVKWNLSFARRRFYCHGTWAE